MSKSGSSKAIAPGTGPAATGQPGAFACGGERGVAWMVDEDPAFYLEEAAPDKRAG